MKLAGLIDFFQNLTPETVADFPKFYAANAYFKDPFNEVRGVEAIQRIFAHMFRQLEAPRFVVTERIVDAAAATLVWEFRYGAPRHGSGAPNLVRGISHLKFDAQGKVNYHRDYWDAAEEVYARLPAIGWLLSGLRRRLSASG